MANYSTRGVIRPDLPKAVFTARALRVLEAAGITTTQCGDGDSHLELAFEDGIDPDAEKRVLQILRHVLTSTEAISHIEIEGSYTADRMVPDGFGGFCTVISRPRTYTWDTNKALTTFRRADELRQALITVLDLAGQSAIDTEDCDSELKEEAERQTAAIAFVTTWATDLVGAL